jgi:hypothetical protein
MVLTQALHGPVESNSAAAEKPRSVPAFGRALSRIVADNALSYVNLLKEIVTLRFGAGRLSFDEYVGLRLYDKALYGAADKKAFVGFRASQKIWLQANYRFDAFGLVRNKIACDMLFAAHGFPVMPTMALFRDQVGREAPFLLRNENELRAFLTQSGHYPLFGKPIDGHRSIGTVSVDRYDAAHNRLVTTTGQGISLDTFVSYVKAHAASGYLLQKRVSPHAAVRDICGERLATVRLLTIVTKGEPKLLRACWKIPAGINVADNFWRPGNLLAQLDLESGRVVRVVRGNGASFDEIAHHPDTGVRILGTVVPHWQEVTQLAIEGAKVLEDMPLVGWDIAPIDTGAVIVELNETPDFKLHQLADRRGILDATLARFLAERKHHAAQWLGRAKQKRRL